MLVDHPSPDSQVLPRAQLVVPGERVGVELITWGPLRAGFNELGHFGTAVFR